MKQVYRVSGPELVYIFKFKGKDIILFGDDHSDNLNKCQGCSKKKMCVNIIDLLKKTKNTDIFVEAAWVPHHLKLNYVLDKMNKHDDVLTSIRKTFYKELYHHNQVTNGKRFHYTDVRREPNIHRLLSVVYSIRSKEDNDTVFVLNTVFDFDTPTKFIDYINACVSSNNFPKALQGIFGKKDANEYIVKQELTSLPFKKRKNVHRIRKQIGKLPEDQQSILMHYHNDKLMQLTNETFYTNYVKNRELAIRDENITSPYLSRVNHMFIYSLVHLMDMYHLARIMYYIDKQNNIISYTGSDHTHNYYDFFKNYMGLSLEHVDDKSKLAQDAKNKRCVCVPNNLF